MTDRDALLRAICDDPDDDAPRLIYADWLDENGDPLQAEFIRLQMKHSPDPLSKSDESPVAKRQLELWKVMRKWRYARTNWVNLGFLGFNRGFSSNWSGTPEEFIRAAPLYWRYGPINTLLITFEKKPEVNRAEAQAIANCEWLKNIRIVNLYGRWLSDEWVSELLKSPYVVMWSEFHIDGPCLTDSICETLTCSVLASNKAKVQVRSSRLTDVGLSAIQSTFQGPDELDD